MLLLILGENLINLNLTLLTITDSIEGQDTDTRTHSSSQLKLIREANYFTCQGFSLIGLQTKYSIPLQGEVHTERIKLTTYFALSPSPLWCYFGQSSARGPFCSALVTWSSLPLQLSPFVCSCCITDNFFTPSLHNLALLLCVSTPQFHCSLGRNFLWSGSPCVSIGGHSTPPAFVTTGGGRGWGRMHFGS